MGSEQIHVIDPTRSLIIKLWCLALLGLVIPAGIATFWPDLSWAGKAARAFDSSMESRVWEDPWQPIDQRTFSSGWIRCGSLDDALALDRKIDDGNLHTGQLILSEGGLAWIPE